MVAIIPHAHTQSSISQPDHFSHLPGGFVISTPRLTIDDPDQSDLAALAVIAADIKRKAAATKGLPYIIFKDTGEVDDDKLKQQKSRPRTEFDLAIRFADAKRHLPFGSISIDFNDLSRDDHWRPDTEIYVDTRRPASEQQLRLSSGAATEAYTAICMLGFMLNYEEMLREIAPENKPSVQMARNLGYVSDGMNVSDLERFILTLDQFSQALPELIRKQSERYAAAGIDIEKNAPWLKWSSADWKENILRARSEYKSSSFRPEGISIGPFHYRFQP